MNKTDEYMFIHVNKYYFLYLVSFWKEQNPVLCYDSSHGIFYTNYS